MDTMKIDLCKSSLISDFSSDVNAAVERFNSTLCGILDTQAPELKKTFVVCEEKCWINEDILSSKRDTLRTARMWRKSRLTVHHLIYQENCRKVKYEIQKAKTNFLRDQVEHCKGDHKKLFKIVDKLLGRARSSSLPSSSSTNKLVETSTHSLLQRFQIFGKSLTTLRIPYPH